jgi:hypothetical protein
MIVKNGTWKKGDKLISGKWWYNYGADCFYVHFDGYDPETGLGRQPVAVHGESPNVGGWQLLEPSSET